MILEQRQGNEQVIHVSVGRRNVLGLENSGANVLSQKYADILDKEQGDQHVWNEVNRRVIRGSQGIFCRDSLRTFAYMLSEKRSHRRF